MNSVTVLAVHNEGKTFTVDYEPGRTLMQIVNRHFGEPRKEGIPFLCGKGACRSCTIQILEHAELLAEPTPLESRALAVGRTAIRNGFRLACLCCFKAL